MIMLKMHKMSSAALVLLVLGASPVNAHFKLTKPASWLKEDAVGGPQKGGPCGPGGIDDVQPPPVSNEIATYHAGETITVEWVDTIAHPGHFRIALAEDRTTLKDPDIKQDTGCSYDESKVPTGAHDNVLADGVAFRPRSGSYTAGMKFSAQVTLPDKPCDKCTLQVVQIMEADLQSLSNCHYFHCADIKILPADGGAAGSAGVGSAAGTTGSAGKAASGSGGVTAGTSSQTGTAGVGVAVAGSTGSTGTAGISAAAGVAALPVSDPSVPATGTSTGAQGVAGTLATAPAAAGSTAAAPPAAATPSSSSSSGGCSVREAGGQTNNVLLGVWLLAVVAVARRRRTRIR
jgi:MYXO-CTERM domain-containing protein